MKIVYLAYFCCVVPLILGVYWWNVHAKDCDATEERQEQSEQTDQQVQAPTKSWKDVAVEIGFIVYHLPLAFVVSGLPLPEREGGQFMVVASAMAYAGLIAWGVHRWLT